ncbi:MAG TPA: hypothetical protein VFC44_00610 [Candidatus Saccharimonadales bacterium]|nr:hypothetical protein [Candidatus Saccharimonadales bacterium]
MNSGKIFFNSVKEDRGWYFAEYSPPRESFRFATLDLVILNDIDKAKIVHTMETELPGWLSRYPIPLMVTAFDTTGNLIHLNPIKECNSLIGFLPKGKEPVSLNWRLLKDAEMPDDALNQDYLKKVYSEIPYRTGEDIDNECKKQNRIVKTIKWVIFFWAVIVPLTVLILDKLNVWVGWMVFAFSLWKIIVEILKRTGRWKKSSRQLEKEKEELEMRHHDYHCKRNPQAFLRLRSENFKREAREGTQKEVESLKRGV